MKHFKRKHLKIGTGTKCSKCNFDCVEIAEGVKNLKLYKYSKKTCPISNISTYKEAVVKPINYHT